MVKSSTSKRFAPATFNIHRNEWGTHVCVIIAIDTTTIVLHTCAQCTHVTLDPSSDFINSGRGSHHMTHDSWLCMCGVCHVLVPRNLFQLKCSRTIDFGLNVIAICGRLLRISIDLHGKWIKVQFDKVQRTNSIYKICVVNLVDSQTGNDLTTVVVT